MVKRAQADVAEIQRALALLLEPGQLAELRALRTKRGTISGYFNDQEKLAQAAASLSGRAPSVYVTLNPVNPELIARAANRVKEYARETTADRDILNRRWLPIDFDAVRPAGVSSTDGEHEAALDRARACRCWLAEQGWPKPIFADSGNGAHLLYRVDLQAEDMRFVELSLKALAARFDDARVHNCRFKAGITQAFGLAQEANRYLDTKAPWKTIKEDRGQAGASLTVAIQAINCLKTILYPFMPFSSQKVIKG